MPKLTRRSRILIAIALVAVLLLLIGPRLIDAYVDWLWFGELGYRSVFTTVLATRLILFLVVSLLIGAIVFGAFALAYRTRPVFVPTNGPNDPVARYRTAVMSRLKLVGIGVPAAIGFFAGIVAQSYWDRVQLFLHGGSFGVTDNARRQLAEKLKIPFPFFQRLEVNHPDLLSQNVNTLLHREPQRPMVRTLDGNVRAFLSDSYRPLDNYDLAEVLFHVV